MHRAAVARGDGGDRASVAHELVASGDAVARLGAHRLGGMLVHADHFVGVDDVEVEAGGVVLRQLAADLVLWPDQQDADALLARGLHGAEHHLGGSIVAAHRVERDALAARSRGAACDAAALVSSTRSLLSCRC